MPEATKARLQKERAIGSLQRQAATPIEKGNRNQTAMLLAQAALRHARRTKNLHEIQACKDAIEFFENNPYTGFITNEQREELYENVRLGLPARKAVLIAGIEWSTFRTWRRLGGHRDHFAPEGGRVKYTQAPEPFRSFVVDLYKAEAEAQKRMLEKLVAMPDTRAITFFLERRFPEEWGRREPEPVQVGQASQSTVNIVIPDNNRGGVVVSSSDGPISQESDKAAVVASSGDVIVDEDDIDAPTLSFFMDDAVDAVDVDYEVLPENEEGEYEDELAAAQEALAKMIAKAERTASGSEEMASPPKSQRTSKRKVA